MRQKAGKGKAPDGYTMWEKRKDSKQKKQMAQGRKEK